MEISVRFFARFKEIVGTSKLTETIQEGSTLDDLLIQLREQFTDFPLETKYILLSVNQEFATPDKTLKDGDEVAIFPPVSGGSDQLDSPHEKFRLTYDPISIDEVAKQVTYPHTGAVTTFTGIIRNVTGDKTVSSLEYEAYHDMAIAKMAEVCAEAREKWPQIVDVAIVQRIGHLQIGEVAIAIAVSSGHRDQGCFEACQYSINRLKEIVPVWKKEFGPDGEEWVEGDYNPSFTSD
ncbi:MAG: MoaD family protein [Chloroflexota bacterium]